MASQKISIFTFAKSGGAGRVSILLSTLFEERGVGARVISRTDSGLRASAKSSAAFSLLPLFFLALIDRYVIRKSSWKSEFSLLRDLYKSRVVPARNHESTALLRWTAGFVDFKSLSKKGYSNFILIPPDYFPFTGGCHYSLGCEQFKRDCSECPAVRSLFRPLVAKNQSKKLMRAKEFGDKVKVVYPSQGVKEKFSQTPIGKSFRESRVIPHPLDAEFMVAQKSKNRKGDQKITIIMVAENLDDPIKSVENAIQSFSRASEVFRLTLIGHSGSLRSRYGNSNDFIKFTGHLPQNEITQELLTADIFLVASDEEFFGSAALQALACGLPVMSPPNSGTYQMCADLGLETAISLDGQIEAQAQAFFESQRYDEVLAKISKIDFHTRNQRILDSYLESLNL